MMAPITFPSLTQIASTTATSGGAGGTGFQNILQSAINQVETSNNTANQAVQGFISGENNELHSTILATQKADLQFEMFMQARNKIVGAYEEIMKMQV